MISKKYQTEVLSLLQMGYSIDSICKVMSKRYKGIEFKSSDLVILAKKMNIKVGKKDLSKEKLDLNMAKQALPELMKDTDFMGKVKKSIAIIVISLLVLLGVIGYLTNLKTMFICLGVLLVFVFAFLTFCYFKYVRKDKQILRNSKK